MPCGPVQFSTRTKNRVLRLRDGQIGRRNGLRGLRSGQVQNRKRRLRPLRSWPILGCERCRSVHSLPSGLLWAQGDCGASRVRRVPSRHIRRCHGAAQCDGLQALRGRALLGLDALQSDNKAVIPCKACPRGRWSESVGLQESAGCVNCDVGRFSGVSALKNKSGCAACAAGKYSESVGVSDPNQCQGCPGGFQQPKRGQSFCLQCVPGQYQEKEAQPACQLCDVNRFANETAMTSCHLCPIGTVAVRQGATLCSACPAGRFGEAGPMYWMRCRSVQRGRCRLGAFMRVVPGGFLPTRIRSSLVPAVRARKIPGG